MSRVGPIIVFIITIVAGGIYWATWEGCREYLDDLLIQDVYYELMFFVWRMIPAVLIFVGIMCLIVAGMGRSKQVVEY